MAREYYSVGEAAKALGISVDTLRRWETQGRIMAERDSGNRRIIPASEIERLRTEPGSAQLSASNHLIGVITGVEADGIVGQVEMLVTTPVRLIALLPRDAIDELGLRPGMAATVIVASTSLIVEP
jgi:excisionase family DNA binding protein